MSYEHKNKTCTFLIIDLPPGGGSISAYCGTLGIALGVMVANLSSHKRGWDDKWEEYSNWAEQGINYQNKLLELVDEDTNAFNKIIDAYRMPKDNDENKNKRTDAIQEATKYAITVPFKIMETSYKSMSIIKKMAEIGNPNSITDAAVGALCARTSVLGAFLNVRINCKDCEDQKFVSKIIKQGNEIVTKTNQLEKEVLEITNSKI